MLHPRVEPPRADRLIERVVDHGAEPLAVGTAKALDGFAIEMEFAYRAQDESLQPPGAPLCQGIEFADRLDLVAEKIDAQGHCGARREHVDDPAAQSKLTGLGDIGAARIAVGTEERYDLFRCERLAFDKLEHRGLEAALWRHALQEGGHGRYRYASARRRIGEPAQTIDAPGNDVAVGRDAVIGQAVPSRDGDYFEFGRKEGQLLHQSGHPQIVDADVKKFP